MKIFIAGDLFISRPLPTNKSKKFEELIEFISGHDVAIANCETTIHDNEGVPHLFPGGGYAMARSECAAAIKQMGINMVGLANNHTMDYSESGLIATIKNLKAQGIEVAGAGHNLAEASRARYLEASDGRVALISLTSSFHPSNAAGHASLDVKGRPGVNPLRHKTTYTIPKDDYLNLKKIAIETEINAYHDTARKEGYLNEESGLQFGPYFFEVGDETKCNTTPNIGDLKRVIEEIHEARLQSNFIIISVHGHQIKGNDKSSSPDFLEIFCRACIDEGANLVVCHGPHRIRGMERYKQGFIFYGLGDFLLQNETVEYLPADFREKYELSYNSSVAQSFYERNKGNTRGLVVDKKAWEGLALSIEITESEFSLELYPMKLGFELPTYLRGWPTLSKNNSILNEFIQLSENYGLSFELDDNLDYLKI